MKWPWLTPRQVLPKMQIWDIDNDGDDEIAISLYVGSGTGIAYEDLHIVEFDDSTGMVLSDSILTGYDIGNKIDYKISLSHTNESQFVEFMFEDKTMSIPIPETLNLKEGIYGYDTTSLVSFDFENNKIKTNMKIGILGFGSAQWFDFVSLNADITYQNNLFFINNCEVVYEPR